MGMGSVAIRLGSAKLGGFAGRVAMQAAISATIMTGLHVAASQGFAPAGWLFGPAGQAGGETPAGAPGSGVADRELGERSPDIRFIAIPAAEAFPKGDGPVSEPPARRTAESTDSTSAPVEKPGQQADSAGPAERSAPNRAQYAETPALPAIVAIPTPRPVARTAAPRHAPEPVEVAEMGVDRRPFEPMPLADDGPELARDAMLEPPMPEDEGFGVRSLIPEGRLLIRGAKTVGLTARDAIEGAALGALAIVGAR